MSDGVAEAEVRIRIEALAAANGIQPVRGLARGPRP